MRCAFCEADVTIRPVAGPSEGETGGFWKQDELECAGCGGIVVHDLVEKIGDLRESWHIKRLPASASVQSALHCPACDARLVSAWPPDARPAPVTSFRADAPAHALRRTEHACMSCQARYVLDEQLESTWSGRDDGKPIQSPRPYPRR